MEEWSDEENMYDDYKQTGIDTYLSCEQKFMPAEEYEVDADKRRQAFEIMLKVYECKIDLPIFTSHWQRTHRIIDNFIPYFALSVYDRFVSRHQEPLMDHQFELCVLCCLFIAWKIRDKSFRDEDFWDDVRKIPKENWFDIFSLTFVKEQRRDEMLRMEYMIGEKLKWRIWCLTPTKFKEFFSPCFKENVFEGGKFERIVIESQSRIELIKLKPSLIAASIMLAMSTIALRDTIIDQILQLEKCILKKEDINACVKVIEEVIKSLPSA